MDTEKKKRGRPRKQKFFENSGMSYDGAINYALDKEVQSELDDTLAHKSEGELTDDERKYLKRKKEKKSYTLNVRFTESEMQDILAKCDQYGYKNKTEYIRDCVRARFDLAPDSGGLAEVNKAMKRIGTNINQIAVRLHSTREHTVQLLISATQTKPQTANMLLATCAYLLHLEHQNSLETSGSQSAQDEAEASAST